MKKQQRHQPICRGYQLHTRAQVHLTCRYVFTSYFQGLRWLWLGSRTQRPLHFTNEQLTHTQAPGGALYNILQQIAIDRSKEMGGETPSAISQCRIWVCVCAGKFASILVNNPRKIWSSRSTGLWSAWALDTHTHARTSGGRGGGREQGQPATTKQQENERENNTSRKQARGAHNKQAEQRKEKGGGRGRKHTHGNPNPGRQKSKQRKAEQAQTTAARQLKQDSTGKEQTHSWGWGEGERGCGEGKGGRQRRKGKGREGEGRRMSQAMRSASMDPPGRRGKVHRAPSYTQASKVTPRGGRVFLCQVALDHCQV